MYSHIFFLYLLVFFVFGKWLLIIVLFPFQCVKSQSRKHPTNKLYRFLAAPYSLFEKLMRNGWQRYMLFQVSMIPSLHIRKWVYKCLGAEIGKNVVIHFRTEIRCPYKLKIGKGTIIGDNALLQATRGISIGENVNLSSNVSIYSGQHDHRDPYFRSLKIDNSIFIGDRAWIGSNVIILPKVKIGEGAVCCAGCVVTKDVEPYSVVAGIPARKVNERPRDLKYNFTGRSCRLY